MFQIIRGRSPYPGAKTRVTRAPGWPDGGPPRCWGLRGSSFGTDFTLHDASLDGWDPTGTYMLALFGSTWSPYLIVAKTSDTKVLTSLAIPPLSPRPFIFATPTDSIDFQALARLYMSGLTGHAASVRWGVIFSVKTVAQLSTTPWWFPPVIP